MNQGHNTPRPRADKVHWLADPRDNLLLTGILLQRHDPVQDDLVVRAVGVQSLWEVRISNMINIDKTGSSLGE